MNEIKHTIVLPVVDKVHEVLYSFLRTSDWGEWSQNPEMPSDPFVVHLVRWRSVKRGLFGLGGRQVPPYTNPSWHPREITMWLKVTVRPSPSAVRVNLFYSFQPFVRGSGKTVLKQVFGNACKYVENEVRALAAYLKDCYELPETPAITCE